MANHRFDVDSRAINCLNGELHFRDGNWHLETHDRENYRTTQIPILYDPQATAPRFEQFLNEIFEGDKDAEEKKIIANQRNALKSTGPRTEQGKAIVCQNAKTHGILSQEVPMNLKGSFIKSKRIGLEKNKTKFTIE